jgi:hypothetical protein
MDETPSDAFDDSDLEASFYSALSLLGVSGYSVCASFRPFSSVRHKASLDRLQMRVEAQVSDAFRLSTREALLGLALYLCARLFGKKVENEYVRAFREFSKKGSLLRLSDSMRQVRGRQRRHNAQGAAHDLSQIGTSVMEKYSRVVCLPRMPAVFWNDRGGKRTLAFYDRAFDAVLVSRIFDSVKVPRFVLEYLCFHEFLHAKYAPLYERGKSMRVIVHSTAFCRDEEKFAQHREAEEWLSRNVRRL